MFNSSKLSADELLYLNQCGIMIARDSEIWVRNSIENISNRLLLIAKNMANTLKDVVKICFIIKGTF